MTPRPETATDWIRATENARRLSRFRHARNRIIRIRDADPAFTHDQLAELAAELLSNGTAGATR